MICISNCSHNRLDLQLGRVELDEMAPLVKHKLEYVAPAKLDMALEEQ